MIHYSILGSGSSGNAYLVEGEKESILVDNGYSVKEMIRRAEIGGHDLSRLKAVLLTHTHGDHLRGVGAAARRFKVPVLMHHRLSAASVVKNGKPEIIPVYPGKVFPVGDIAIEPFSTSHDAPYSLGYTLQLHNRKFLFLTDTGIIPAEAAGKAEEADVMFLEANYDDQMLIEGPYPPVLKRRIRSEKGHLSNDCSAGFLLSLMNNGARYPRRVYLCHLSDTNNSPEKVAEAFSDCYSNGGNIVICGKNMQYSYTLSPG